MPVYRRLSPIDASQKRSPYRRHRSEKHSHVPFSIELVQIKGMMFRFRGIFSVSIRFSKGLSPSATSTIDRAGSPMECDVDDEMVSVTMKCIPDFPQLLFQYRNSMSEVPMELDHDVNRSANVSNFA